MGLVTAEEFKRVTRESEELAKRKKEGLFEDGGDVVDGEGVGGGVTEKERVRLEKRRRREEKKARKKRKKTVSVLSFADAEDADGIIEAEDDEDHGDSATSTTNTTQPSSPSTTKTAALPHPTKELKKNPDVDTSFLPDRERQTNFSAEMSMGSCSVNFSMIPAFIQGPATTVEGQRHQF